MRNIRECLTGIDFKDIVATAEGRARDMEPWSNYFRLRAGEMEALLSLYKPKARGVALDIGSGLGFNTILLKKIYDKVVASDLYAEDALTHTLGMDKSNNFLRRMGVDGVEAASSRCEELPFGKGSFNAVYMIYTLEHIKDRARALEEARRVLKPGGELIIVVPNFLERLFYPLSFYRDILLRLVGYFKRHNGSGKSAAKNISAERGSSYPHFPMPEPHGEYADYCSELMKTNTFQWISLARNSGFAIRDIFTTMLFPKELSSFVLGAKALDYYLKTRRINNILGRRPFLRSLGQNLCLILEKRDA